MAVMDEAEAQTPTSSIMLSGVSAGSLREGEHFWDFAVHVAVDTAKNLVLLLALSIIFFAARWLKQLGMDSAHLHLIEQLHFWVTFAALAWIGILFLIKLVRRSLK